MIVLSVSACPSGLTGAITKWLMEVSPGVYVGHLSARVRDELWGMITENIKHGRAVMVYSTNTEQGLEYRTCGETWNVVDFDGVLLTQRPHKNESIAKSVPENWSIAARRRKFMGRR